MVFVWKSLFQAFDTKYKLKSCGAVCFSGCYFLQGLILLWISDLILKKNVKPFLWWLLYLFLANVLILYPLIALENPWFSNVFRVYKIGPLAKSRLRMLYNSITNVSWKKILTLSWRRFLSYRNQSIDLLCKPVSIW